MALAKLIPERLAAKVGTPQPDVRKLLKKRQSRVRFRFYWHILAKVLDLKLTHPVRMTVLQRDMLELISPPQELPGLRGLPVPTFPPQAR
jgi:hypothetical protein